MKRYAFFLSLVLCSIQMVLSQSDLQSRVKFKGEFEERIFQNPDSAAEVALLLAISEGMDFDKSAKVQRTIDNFRLELDSKNLASKSEDKKIKLLFNLTHKMFFEKYVHVSNFNKIFDAKEYNCVSATALYVILLKSYDIPFSIKEAPSHIYSIAYPNSKGIILESTAPGNGYYAPGSNDIQKAVNSLVKLKYVTQKEVDAKGVRQVYNDFFYGEEDINLKQLAGLQYYNEALGYYSEEDYEMALNSAYKAEILYPSDKIEFLKYVLLSSILSKTEFKKQEDIVFLTDYANLANTDNGEIINAYNVIMNNRLFLEGNIQFSDSAYSYLSNNVKDSLLIRTLSEIHFSSYSQYYIRKSDLGKALEFSSKAFEINPKNVNTQALITQSIIQRLSMSSGSVDVVNQLMEYQNSFPFLNENSLFQSFLFFNYSTVAYYHFRADDPVSGFKYLRLMEALIDTFKEKLKVNENQYGLVYAEAGAHYYRKREYSKAKEILEKGMKIMPNHPELKVRLEIVMEEFR